MNSQSKLYLEFWINGVLESSLEVLGFDFGIMNSSKYFRLINSLKIPKITLICR